jgi:hypothetical protein
VALTLARLADVRGQDPEWLGVTTVGNTQRLFALPDATRSPRAAD